MKSELFDYQLPNELIAQSPSDKRENSRLLVVDRATRKLEHRHFSDLHEYLGENDLLFRNTARVLPARLFAKRIPTEGAVECLLLKPSHDDSQSWWCLLRPGKRLPVGSQFGIKDVFQATVLDKNEQSEYLVRFESPNKLSVAQIAETHGKLPLPPYIDRDKQDPRDSADKDRYQTVYAENRRSVAAAAPTAGLHFTPEILDQLHSKDVTPYDLVLHVGMGTFKPLETETVEKHQIHKELYEIPPAAQAALRSAPKDGKRRIAVGTTSMRTIEDSLSRFPSASDTDQIAEADIFIYPPHQFKGVDALITNFHLPKSTLLCLVAAFLSQSDTDGISWLQEIYQTAIDKEYRFLSYGDAMLIL